MIAGTLSRYFFRRQVATILRFLMGILLLVVVVDFTEVSSRLPDDTKFTTLDTLYLSLLRMPSIVETTFPFIILFASMATLISLNRKNELVVTRSTGVSAWQFLAPLAAASFIVGLLLVTVVNPIAAHTLRLAELQEVLAGLRNNGSVDGTRPPWLRQRTDEGTTIIGAETMADGGLLLGNAMFLRINPEGEVVERQDAQERAPRARQVDPERRAHVPCRQVGSRSGRGRDQDQPRAGIRARVAFEPQDRAVLRASPQDPRSPVPTG